MADESLVLFKNSLFRLLSMASSVVSFTSLHTQTQDIISVDGGSSSEQFTLLEFVTLIENTHDTHPGTSLKASQLLRKQRKRSKKYALQAGSLSHSDLQILSLPRNSL